MKLAMGLLIAAGVGPWATPARATLTPTVFPSSTQVMTTPIVMDFKTPASSTSQVAFVSFDNSSGVSGGVLRVIDASCTEIARFPDTACPFTLPANCPGNLATVPQLVPISCLAAGRLDPTVLNPVVDIVGVLDNNKQIIAFNLVGGCLKPKWCSPPLGAFNSISSTAAPAIAQLDGPGTAALRSEVVVDNKVFGYNGAIRYPGLFIGPRSRAVVVANPSGTPLPQLITGGGAYKGGVGGVWTGSLGWQSSAVTNSPLVYPAIADLDLISLEGPVIAALAPGPSPGRVIVAASDYNIGLGGNRGVRIFSDNFLGPARNFWNQASYRGSNVSNSSGAIPTIEPPSWLTPFHNTFRVQQYP